MPIRVVESKQNARVKELRKALSGRGAEELAGIEGLHLLEEALRAGLRIKTIFLAQGAEKLLGATHLAGAPEILAVPKAVLDAVLTTETPQPVAALIEPPQWSWAHVLPAHQTGAALVVVLAGIQDPGNLGTIVRSAEAFGATGVVCLTGTVSAWNPKAVRASAGSVFRVPIMAASERICLERLREAGVKVWATAARGARPVDLVDLAAPVAIVIGNEGNGIDDDLLEKADETITIPCPGSVESLNAAMAAAVLLYEASRQRVVESGGPATSRKTEAHRGARR